ncbi:hypothetical protein GCM10022197_32560 [Microlunatus spumicola]|uniref:PucR C-terminal helix-turn-helix domain-containing protein n=1 Tax=Microlunatus spumicola TaxID=81499 RepID=A0ABP6XVV9_9ACTN
MPTTSEPQPEPDGHEDVQRGVDRLAARLDLSVLVEDRRGRPVWWSTRGPVDGTRVRTILNRRVDTDVARAVRTFDLAHAVAPVRTPGIPELEMWARWCMPVHLGDELLGLLWVLDPEDRVAPQDFPAIVGCAEQAAGVLARAEVSRRDVALQRDQLLRVLLRGRDPEAAAELARLERLAPDARVQVDAVRRGGWALADGFRAHVAGPRPHPATSGAPLPLADLAEAVRRARVTLDVVRAGGLLDPVSWDALGAWRLVVEAPDDLPVAALHPAAETLAALPRPDLMSTARTVLDLGGDVAAAAEQAHLHRTTLYHRLDRIEQLTGVDLRLGRNRTDLQLALWLVAYRNSRAEEHPSS